MRPLALAAALLILACDHGSPEARIRKRFQASVEAVEAGDAGAAAAPLSPSFSGPEGMDRAAARFYLMGILRQEKVGVTVVSQRVEVSGTRAAQTVELLLTGRTGSTLLPAESTRKALLLQWELRDGEWLIREIQEN